MPLTFIVLRPESGHDFTSKNMLEVYLASVRNSPGLPLTHSQGTVQTLGSVIRGGSSLKLGLNSRNSYRIDDFFKIASKLKQL